MKVVIVIEFPHQDETDLIERLRALVTDIRAAGSEIEVTLEIGNDESEQEQE